MGGALPSAQSSGPSGKAFQLIFRGVGLIMCSQASVKTYHAESIAIAYELCCRLTMASGYVDAIRQPSAAPVCYGDSSYGGSYRAAEWVCCSQHG